MVAQEKGVAQGKKEQYLKYRVAMTKIVVRTNRWCVTNIVGTLKKHKH